MDEYNDADFDDKDKMLIANAWEVLATNTCEVAKRKGFWDDEMILDGLNVIGAADKIAKAAKMLKDLTTIVQLALVATEVGEAIEGERKQQMSDHIEGFTAAEEECADVIIRVAQLGHRRGWRIADAIFAKHRFNMSRPHKHGKAF